MNKIVLSVLLFATSFCFGQDVVTAEVKESKITSLVYTVDSLEELKTINWNDIKDLLKENENKEKVELGFRVKSKNSDKDTLSFKHSFEIKSDADAIDSSISIAKRIIQILEKL